MHGIPNLNVWDELRGRIAHVEGFRVVFVVCAFGALPLRMFVHSLHRLNEALRAKSVLFGGFGYVQVKLLFDFNVTSIKTVREFELGLRDVRNAALISLLCSLGCSASLIPSSSSLYDWAHVPTRLGVTMRKIRICSQR